ncbi:hypothetical protein CHUAL_010782 [Chamberlinius hualienensis]
MLRYDFFSILAVVCLGVSFALPTPCNQLPRPKINIKELLEHQPYTTYWTSWPILHCSETAYLLPQTGQTGFNLTNVILVGSVAVHFHLILEDDNIWKATMCSTGYLDDYPTVYKNFNGTSKSLCVVSCAGPLYTYVICWGKTAADREELLQFLKKHEIPAYVDAQIGCDIKNKVCSALDHGTSFLNSDTSKLFQG